MEVRHPALHLCPRSASSATHSIVAVGSRVKTGHPRSWRELNRQDIYLMSSDVQEDGNLVLYTVDRKVAWASNTDNRNSDAYTLEVRSLPFKPEGESAPHCMSAWDTSSLQQEGEGMPCAHTTACFSFIARHGWRLLGL